MDEIKQALFDMAPFKDPGPDGIHAGFYQKMWSVFGELLRKMAIIFFATSEIPKGTNDTLLALIPKFKHPEVINQFTPIILCNVT